MRKYTDAEITDLIKCKKTVTEAPRKKIRSERGSLRNDFKLTSLGYEGEFVVFLRINEKFRENFSLGLEYFPKGEKGSICLLRCNGPHGSYLGESHEAKGHSLFHIHKAKSANIEAGLRPEHGGETTKEYACFAEALKYFLDEINLEDNEKFFPGLNQKVFDFINIEEE